VLVPFLDTASTVYIPSPRALWEWSSPRSGVVAHYRAYNLLLAIRGRNQARASAYSNRTTVVPREGK